MLAAEPQGMLRPDLTTRQSASTGSALFGQTHNTLAHCIPVSHIAAARHSLADYRHVVT